MSKFKWITGGIVLAVLLALAVVMPASTTEESAMAHWLQRNPGAFLLALCMVSVVVILWLRRGARFR